MEWWHGSGCFIILLIALLVEAIAKCCSIRNHDVLVYSFQRQRSISLSSLDSENELELDGKSCTGPVGVNNRACRSQTSTHSLNEADLIQVIPMLLQEMISSRGNQVFIANFFSLTERISEDSYKEG